MKKGIIMKKAINYAMIFVILFAFLTACDNPPAADTTGEGDTTIPVTESTTITTGIGITGSTTAEIVEDASDKDLVVDIFITKGEYSDGVYSFRKYSSSGNCDFVYSFSYKPEIDMFNCGVLITTFVQNITMYDYGSITFTWEEFNSASYYGYHELKDVASIHFDFSPTKLNSAISYENFQYAVRSNSFSNLTNTNDINAYAETCFECARQGWLYAQSILYGYGYN